MLSHNENLIHDTTNSTEKPVKTGIEISMSGSTEAVDELTAFADALNHDQIVTSEDLSRLEGSLKKAKIKLGNTEVTIEQAEEIYGSFGPFLKEIWKYWHVGEEIIKNAKISVEIKSPKDEDYKSRQNDIDPTKFGQFTLNPDTYSLDWETLQNKIFIPDLSSLEGKSITEVLEYLKANYAYKYHFPGIEYLKFMLENPDKVSEQLKDGNAYFNFGSLISHGCGSWCVSRAHWDGSAWDRRAGMLGYSWDSRYRVVLLEK